jgi:hypothetical protein
VVDKTVAVSGASGKARAHSRHEDLLSGVGLKRDLAFEHVDELILSGMRMSMGRLSAGNNPRHNHPVILQSGMVAEASVVTVKVHCPMGFWIAGSVALRDITWIKCR